MKWYKLMIIRLVSARGSYPRAAKEDAAHAREAPHPMGDWAWVKPKDKGFGPWMLCGCIGVLKKTKRYSKQFIREYVGHTVCIYLFDFIGELACPLEKVVSPLESQFNSQRWNLINCCTRYMGSIALSVSKAGWRFGAKILWLAGEPFFWCIAMRWAPYFPALVHSLFDPNLVSGSHVDFCSVLVGAITMFVCKFPISSHYWLASLVCSLDHHFLQVEPVEPVEPPCFC